MKSNKRRLVFQMIILITSLVSFAVASHAYGAGLVSLRNGTVYDGAGNKIVPNSSTYKYAAGMPVCPVNSVVAPTGERAYVSLDFLTYYFKNRQEGVATVVIRGIHKMGFKDAIILKYRINTNGKIVPARSISSTGSSSSGSTSSSSGSSSSGLSSSSGGSSGSGSSSSSSSSPTATTMSITSAAVTIADQTYSGSALSPATKVVLNGKTLVKETDYTVVYSSNTDAGTAKATITGKGNYKDSVVKKFKIKPVQLSTASVSGISNKNFTGSAIKQSPTLKRGSKTLKSGSDYIIAYKNNVKAGTATMTLTGKGNYTGTVTKTFKISDKNVKPIISADVVMVDNWRYDTCTLKVSMTPAGAYKNSDVKWQIVDAANYTGALRFTKSGKTSKTTSGGSVTVKGLKYGNGKIVAKLPNGNTATCNFKVIASALEQVKDGGDTIASRSSGEYRTYSSKKYPNMSKKRIYVRKKSESWGNKYVEAYVNNAAKLVKECKQSKFKDETKAKTIKTYRHKSLKIKYDNAKKLITSASGGYTKFKASPGGSSWKRTDMKKKTGEMSPNDYIFCFFNKNQWGYMLHKDKSGTYKVVEAQKLSAGMIINTYETYFTVEYLSDLNLTMDSWDAQTMYSSYGPAPTAHCDTSNVHGYPSSNGCLHVGKLKSSHMYYQLFVKAGLGTRFMNV